MQQIQSVIRKCHLFFIKFNNFGDIKFKRKNLKRIQKALLSKQMATEKTSFNKSLFIYIDATFLFL